MTLSGMCLCLPCCLTQHTHKHRRIIANVLLSAATQSRQLKSEIGEKAMLTVLLEFCQRFSSLQSGSSLYADRICAWKEIYTPNPCFKTPPVMSLDKHSIIKWSTQTFWYTSYLIFPTGRPVWRTWYPVKTAFTTHNFDRRSDLANEQKLESSQTGTRRDRKC